MKFLIGSHSTPLWSPFRSLNWYQSLIKVFITLTGSKTTWRPWRACVRSLCLPARTILTGRFACVPSCRAWEVRCGILLGRRPFEVLAARTTPLEVAEHEANSKAVNALFAGLSRAEFGYVQEFKEAHKIWTCLENYHEGTPQVKARLYETHRCEYENFTQEPGESIEVMFSHFQSIVNKVSANKAAGTLDYTEHEKALKLLYALDRSV